MYLDCITNRYWNHLVESINGSFMHYTAGLILSIVFQLAHVVEETTNPSPNELGEMDNTWAIHQLFTTTNFAPNAIVNWYTGGLNHQIEHHIFPNISHVHYGKIAKIVKKRLRM
jgi:linoleoyl-CoA desaturase